MVFIVALIAMATTLTLSTSRSGRVVMQQAEEMQRVLILTAQTAMIEQVELGVGLWNNGYAIWKYDEVNGNWQRVMHDRALTEYQLPSPLSFKLAFAFPQSLPSNPNTIKIPQIWFSATGTATPATITISSEETQISIEIGNDGEVNILEPQ